MDNFRVNTQYPASLPDAWYFMLELRLAGFSLEEIGVEFKVSRERIRQCLSILRTNDEWANEEMNNVGLDKPHSRPNTRPRKPQKEKPRVFSMAVQRWLIAEGSQYCWNCNGVKDFNGFHPLSRRRLGMPCRECSTNRHNAYIETHPEQLDYQAAYRKSERGKEVGKRATARWLAKPENKEKMRKYKLERYHKMRKTAKGRATIRRYWRTSSENRRARRQAE